MGEFGKELQLVSETEVWLVNLILTKVGVAPYKAPRTKNRCSVLNI